MRLPFFNKNKPTSDVALNREMSGSRRFSICLAFFIPVLILMLAYATRGVWPVTNRQILTIDLYHQYAPFLEVLRQKISNLDFSTYSFVGGLGTNFFVLFWYYLASPFNAIYMLLPSSFLAEGILLITLLKVGFASIGFQIFVHRFFQRTGALSIAFSSCYALSSFFIAYGWNIMWLDTLILLPLVTLFLIEGFRNGRFLLYSFLVASTIVVNYYMAFFVAIFVVVVGVLCFVNALFGAKGVAFARAFKWLFFSALGIAMSAIVILPVFYALRQTAAFPTGVPSTWQLTSPFLDILYRHTPFLAPNVREGLPNLYSTVLVLLLVPIFFISTKIGLKQKIMVAVAMVILLLSFNHNLLNVLWHGGHVPNQLPHRFAFIYIFVVLATAYAALPSLRELRQGVLAMIFGLLALMLLVIEKTDFAKASPYAIFGGLIILAVYALVLSKSNCKKSERALPILLSCLVLFELIASTIIGIGRLDSKEYFTSRDGYASGEQVASVRAAVSRIRSEADTLFYRTEILPSQTANDPALYGLNGVSLFSSTMPKGQTSFMTTLGMETNGLNSVQYGGQTELFNAIFNVKYLIRRQPLSYSGDINKRTFYNDQIEVSKLDKTLGLAFVINQKAFELKLTGKDVFDNQNAMATSFGSAAPILQNIALEEGVAASTTSGKEVMQKATLMTTGEGEYYVYFDFEAAVSSIKVAYSDKNFAIEPRSGVQSLGILPDNTKVTLEVEFKPESTENRRINGKAAYLEPSKLAEFLKAKQSEVIQLDGFRQDRFSGDISANSDGYILFSIPYDEGWKISIDSNTVKPVKYNDSLLAVPITQGKHTIIAKFQPVFFELGRNITVASVLLYFVLVIITLGYRHRLKRRMEQQKSLDSILLAPETTSTMAETVTQTPAVSIEPDADGVIE